MGKELYMEKESKYPRRGRGGRPVLDQTKRRSRTIGVPVNAEEETCIGERAVAHHMTKTQFLRHLGLGCRLPRPIPTINYEAHRKLGRMAADLNRMVGLICAGKCAGIRPEFAEQLYEELQAIRRQLLGVREHDRENQ